MPLPYTLTPKILASHSEISRLCGLLEGWDLTSPGPDLRRTQRIQAIQGSLAIEGNTLSLDQVTALLSGKRVVGPRSDILEAQNAAKAYEGLDRYDIHSTTAFLKAHRILMDGLLEDAGQWRRGNVGIQKGKSVSHVAPPPGRVPAIMKKLFAFLRAEKTVSLVVLSCIFHYEVSFIHPFMDGNGRMARLWQTAILRRFNPAFAYVPVESVIRDSQKQYYRALELSDRKGESTPFIEFMLDAIARALHAFILASEAPVQTGTSRLEAALARFAKAAFSRKDYRAHFKSLSPATASRDLKLGVDTGKLKRIGDKRTARYRFLST